MVETYMDAVTHVANYCGAKKCDYKRFHSGWLAKSFRKHSDGT